MLVNTANLAIVALASTDEERIELRGLQVEDDGTTVGEPHQAIVLRSTLWNGQEVTLVAMPLRTDPETAVRPGKNRHRDDDGDEVEEEPRLL